MFYFTFNLFSFQDKAIEELKQRLAVAERDAADKANALKLAQRVKEMLSDHVKRQREMIKMLESQIPSQSRSPAPMVMPALGKSVSDSTADSMRPRRRRTCDPTSVLEHRRTRHSRSMRSSVVQV